MQINVVKNAKRNMLFGTVNRSIILVIPFIERTAIQMILGSQYLGLGSLFDSLIKMLSLTELGFSSAMVYNMYKPAAEGNIQRMNALLNYYKKVYRVIGTVILAIGLSLIPFLPRLIKGSHPANITLSKLYIIYLLNTSISYFLYGYLTCLLVVHQREDVRSTVDSCVRVGLAVTQICLLWSTKNYYYFAVMLPTFTIINNLWTTERVKRLFPQYKAEGMISADDRKRIKKLVAGTFIQQACKVTRNSLDSICVSAFLGLTLTAIYNNYYLILHGVTTFVGIFTASIVGGVGNHVAIRSVKENFEEMEKLDFVYLWIAGWCTICLLCLYQPFMKLWMGKDMMLPMSAVFFFCSYFYLLKLGDVRTMYSSANGLWWEHRYRALGETILNLILNIYLGKRYGIHGIILATMISLFLCNYMWSVSIIFKLYFARTRQRRYYIYQGKMTAVMVFAGIITYLFCCTVPLNNALQQFVARAGLCIVIPNVFYYVAFKNSEQFQYAKKLLLRRRNNEYS